MLPKLPPRAIAFGEKHSTRPNYFGYSVTTKYLAPVPQLQEQDSQLTKLFFMFGKHRQSFSLHHTSTMDYKCIPICTHANTRII